MTPAPLLPRAMAPAATSAPGAPPATHALSSSPPSPRAPLLAQGLGPLPFVTQPAGGPLHALGAAIERAFEAASAAVPWHGDGDCTRVDPSTVAVRTTHDLVDPLAALRLGSSASTHLMSSVRRHVASLVQQLVAVARNGATQQWPREHWHAVVHSMRGPLQAEAVAMAQSQVMLHRSIMGGADPAAGSAPGVSNGAAAAFDLAAPAMATMWPLG